MAIEVSVVVPTYRRPDLLERCLTALLAQDYAPAAYEVVVADDAASTATREQVERLARRGGPTLHYVAVSGPHGPAAARNRGWRAAHGPIIAFTDDDCVPTPGWLRAGVAAFALGPHPDPLPEGEGVVLTRSHHPDAFDDLSHSLDCSSESLDCHSERSEESLLAPASWDATRRQTVRRFLAAARNDGGEAGRYDSALGARNKRETAPHGKEATARLAGSTVLERSEDVLDPREPDPRPVAAVAGRLVMPLPDAPTDYERDASGLTRAEFVTANCFVRRAALVAVSGFDERFPSAWREDSDLQFSLLERGARIARASTAVVAHPIRPAPWGISLRQQRKSQYNALLYRKHPRLYRQRIQSSPPWLYYQISGTLLLALVGLLTGRRRVALVAGGLWLGLTGQFCRKRLAGTSHAPGHVAEMALTSALIPPLAICWRLRGALKYRVWFL